MVSVDTHEPRDQSHYNSFAQDDIMIHYSPKLGRRPDVLELDYVRVLFQNKPILAGPEELIAAVLMGRI